MKVTATVRKDKSLSTPRMRRRIVSKPLKRIRRKPVHVDLITGRSASVMAFTRSARGLL